MYRNIAVEFYVSCGDSGIAVYFQVIGYADPAVDIVDSAVDFDTSVVLPFVYFSDRLLS